MKFDPYTGKPRSCEPVEQQPTREKEKATTTPQQPQPTPVRGVDEPYEWVTFLVVVLFILAALVVVGGFIEASNHSSKVMVTHHDSIGLVTGHKLEDQNDWNYAYAGVGWAISLVITATFLILVRGIARDVRTGVRDD
jgi:phosphotransferase system  glucose/maltose/N-acetylglucosamine-specific IIC component